MKGEAAMRVIAYAVAVSMILVLRVDYLPARESQPSKVVAIDIKAQPLASALHAWAQQTGMQIVMRHSHLMVGLTSRSIDGPLSAEEALKALLDETPFDYEFIEPHTAAIRLRTDKNRGTSPSSADETLGVPQSSSLHSTSVARDPSADSNGLSNSPTKGQLASDRQLDQIVVTGSRLRRIDEGPAPITTISRDRIEQLGATNIADVLGDLPQQTFETGELFGVGGARSVRLRGLGLGTTLVLINGRRTVTGAQQGAFNFFNLNAVPLPVVERVEVLSDSASAIYGADAVGGVVNIITRNDLEQPMAELYYGAAEDGADELRTALSFQLSGERGHAIATFDYFERSALMGEDHRLFRDQDFRRFGGADRRLSFANPGNVRSRSNSNLPGLTASFAAVPPGADGVNLTQNDFQATAGQLNRESVNRYYSVVPPAERYSGAAFAQYDLNNSLTAFGELMYSRATDTRRLFPSTATLLVPAQNPYNPFGVDVNVEYLFEGVGGREDVSKVESNRTVVGIKASRGRWDWELAVLRSDEDAESYTDNAVDIGRVNASLASVDPAEALNVFADGPGGEQTLLRSIIAPRLLNKYASEVTQVGGYLRGSLIDAPAGNVEVVFGGEWRNEDLYFDSKSTSILVAEDRDVSAIYSEIRVPIVTREWSVPAIHSLALTVAGRYDQYSDFGGTFNPQYGLEWRPFSAVLLRLSYGTSFRPPSLFELYQPPVTLPVTVTDPRRGNAPTPVPVSLGGNPHLHAEEADSLSMGFVLALSERWDLRVSGNYWSIEQDERVLRFSPNVVLANEHLFPERISRAAPSEEDLAAGRPGVITAVDASSFNFGRLETSGIDAELTARVETRAGQIAPALRVTWVDKYQVADLPGAPMVDRVGVAHTQGTVPRWRASGAIAWTRNIVELSTRVRYSHSYTDATEFNVPTLREVSSTTLVDVQSSFNLTSTLQRTWKWLSSAHARLGVFNLFDAETPFSEVNTMGFDTSQANLRPRFVYLSLQAAL